MTKQKTITHKANLTGNGLHTGAKVSVSFMPMPEYYGIRFQRMDLPWKPIVPALVEYVSDTTRGTSISEGGATIQTVEHVLAAIAGLEIDNLLIGIDGPELPIMDGSAAPFLEVLEEAGLTDQQADKTFISIPEKVIYRTDDGEALFEAHPYPSFRLEVETDFDSGILGVQHAVLERLSDFKVEIAPSRTFCFLHELEHLFRRGMIKGGDLSNAVVITERDIHEGELDDLATLLGKPSIPGQKAGILGQTRLRFTNEPARHKLLDMVGDLSLIGHPIKGKIIAKRPGHTANIALVKMIHELINQPAGHGI